MLFLTAFAAVFVVTCLYGLGYFVELLAWIQTAITYLVVLSAIAKFGHPSENFALACAVFLGCICIAGIGASHRALKERRSSCS